MEYINAVIGETEMFVPTNDRVGELLFTANRRVNYHKYIAKMRKAYQGKIESRAIVMDSDFFYALEDVMEEKGYDSVVHHQFEKVPSSKAKFCTRYSAKIKRCAISFSFAAMSKNKFRDKAYV